MKKKAKFSMAACCLLAANGYSQGTFRITFDGPPVQPPGTSYSVRDYYESGLSFKPIAAQGTFSRVGPGYQSDPQNGTAYLRAGLGASLAFSFTSGALFNMVSVDLAEYSTVRPQAVTVHFDGYRRDGTVVSTELTTDGVIDGTGPIPDFQTFYFGPEFSDLQRVEIPTWGWSLDNLVVTVPEPGTGALLLLGALLWRAARRTLAHEQASAAANKETRPS